MKVLLFGASGMVGQGVLRECLLEPAVTEVVSVSRSALPAGGVQEKLATKSKLREVVQPDLYNLTSVAGELTGFDACLFCLGVSSFGMKEAAYTRITKDLTLSVAETLLRQNPGMVFAYVSGAGTNAGSKTMWARVKGETENALLAMPFRAAYMFRPGAILPRNGIRSRTRGYNLMYMLLWPLWKLMSLSPKLATDTERVGRAMLWTVRKQPVAHVFDGQAINKLAKQ